jgi:hypothetical protein
MNNWNGKQKQMFNFGNEVARKFLSMQDQVKHLIQENKELKAQILELKKKHTRGRKTAAPK